MHIMDLFKRTYRTAGGIFKSVLPGMICLLAVSQLSAQVNFFNDFKGTSATGLVSGGDATLTPGDPDPEGDGWLRLTPTGASSRFGYACVDNSFPSTE